MTAGAMTLPLAACNDPQDTVTAEQSYGASPSLPAPQTSLIPTVNVAKATGWPSGAKPTATSGMAVNAFATGLDHPRTVYVLPNGDVLAAESNAPPKPDDSSGIKRMGAEIRPEMGPARQRKAPTALRCCAIATAMAPSTRGASSSAA